MFSAFEVSPAFHHEDQSWLVLGGLSTNLANRPRSIQLSTRTMSIDTLDIATPGQLKR